MGSKESEVGGVMTSRSWEGGGGALPFGSEGREAGGPQVVGSWPSLSPTASSALALSPAAPPLLTPPWPQSSGYSHPVPCGSSCPAPCPQQLQPPLFPTCSCLPGHLLLKATVCLAPTVLLPAPMLQFQDRQMYQALPLPGKTLILGCPGASPRSTEVTVSPPQGAGTAAQ